MRFAAALLLAAAAKTAGATVCIADAGLLAFGLYESLLGGPVDTVGTVTVICTPGLGSPLQSNYTITIAGTGSGNDSVRSVASGSSRLYYQVYSDPGRSQVWGNGGSSGAGVSSSVTSVSHLLPAVRVHTVYARTPGGQKVKPGIYLGNLLVTVDY